MCECKKYEQCCCKVDLSKLQDGDSVKFRCGGMGKISGFEDESFGIRLYWVGGTDSLYQFNGYKAQIQDCGYVQDSTPCPFDIIEIIPKPFDWADAKPGMAFKHSCGGTLWYVGESLFESDHVIAWAGGGKTSDYGRYDKSFLKRQPEKDIKK